MVSKDNQVFVHTSEASIPEDAIDKAKAKIIDKGWDRFGYSFTYIEEVNPQYIDLPRCQVSKTLFQRIKECIGC